MNPFAHFEDQFGHLKLSDNDAALHVFLAGWNSAMMEMMQRVNKMPFGDDTRASFAVYFQSQMVNVDAIEKPAQQEPVAWATQLNEYAHIKWGAKRPEYPMVYEFPLYTSPQPAQQEPVLCINPKVIDPATGKVRNGTGALTYSDEPCAGWSLPLYTSPQAREWVGLTDNEVLDMARTFGAQPWPPGSCVALGQMIEAKLREKNA